MSTPPFTRRVGHKGADLIAPGNTEASFRAALDAGVDMIEFDVLPEYPDGHGELFLAHDYTDRRARRATGTLLTLDDGLDLLASAAFDGIELDVDIKLPRYEEQVATALAGRDLLGRTIVSTMETTSLAVLRQFDPAIRLGWSVPKIRNNPLERPLARPFVMAFGHAYRRALPARAARALREGRCDAIMCHYLLATGRLARAVADAGGELYIWTVDSAEEIQRFEAMNVAGVITNDPRLFRPKNVAA